MKTIKKIFWTDVKNLAKNIFALIIAIGVCFLPALYAWFNIYSNWDPYGNTGSLQMAAVCNDQGYTNDDGDYINVGNEIMDQMAGNDKVDWHFLTTKKEAVEGVESGKYYAAVVIEKNFTYNMYNMFISTDKQPTLMFYQNQKKNPVATKISDTVVTTLEQNINEQFIKVMTTTLFSNANDIRGDIEKDGGTDAFIEKLQNLSTDLESYQDMLDNIITGNAVLSANLADAASDASNLKDQTSESSQHLGEAQETLQDTRITVNSYKEEVNSTVDTILVLLNDVEDTLKKAQISNDVDAVAAACQQAADDTDHLVTDLDALSQSLQAANALDSNTQQTLDQVSKYVKDIQTVVKAINAGSTYTNAANNVKNSEKQMAKDVKNAIDTIELAKDTVNNQLMPQLNNCLYSLEDIMSNTSDLMQNMSGVLASMGDVFGSMQTTITSCDSSLEKTRDALGAINTKISKALDQVKTAKEDDRVKVLVNALSGDPEVYGQYFSEPVKIESVAVFPVENYGSAVAPFYTVLSVWVGVIIMVAIIKVKVDPKKYPEAGPATLFFGRGAFFLAMGQVQTLITVLGNLFILKIQCVHPFLFWLVAAMTSFIFTLLIYALVYTFGDVGKAIAVVILVLQIAGSSGTYPIELLPEFFQKVYIFFPFPYAINAMRESICGLYGSDIVVYLLELSIFLIPALVIGLLLRIPFENLNHYMEKRMEDTEMM